MLAATFSLVAPHLTERQRRLLLAAAAPMGGVLDTVRWEADQLTETIGAQGVPGPSRRGALPRPGALLAVAFGLELRAADAAQDGPRVPTKTGRPALGRWWPPEENKGASRGEAQIW